MRLIDAEEAERLYSHMGPAREISGGSAANTAAGVAALGARAGFIGQLAPDQLGEFYRHDMTAPGVEFDTPRAKDCRSPDRALPDPGHARRPSDDEHLSRSRPDPPASAIDAERIAVGADALSRRLSVGPGHAALRDGHGRSRRRGRPGRKVAFTLSDSFCVDRHRDDFNALLDSGRIDILFANEAEIQALAGVAARRNRRRSLPGQGETLVVTRSENGALATQRRRARRSPGRADRQDWSTRPARATCSRPASSPAKRRAAAWNSR